MLGGSGSASGADFSSNIPNTQLQISKKKKKKLKTNTNLRHTEPTLESRSRKEKKAKTATAVFGHPVTNSWPIFQPHGLSERPEYGLAEDLLSSAQGGGGQVNEVPEARLTDNLN